MPERTSRSSLVQIEDCDEVLNELPAILNSVFRMKVAKEAEVNQARPEKCLEIARDRSTVVLSLYNHQREQLQLSVHLWRGILEGSTGEKRPSS